MSSPRPPPDPALIHLVARDLERLREFHARTWTQDELLDQSVYLRRLLTGNYRRACAQLGFPRQPQVTAPVLEPEDMATVDWAVASMAAPAAEPVKMGGVIWSTPTGQRRTEAEANIAARRRYERWKERGGGHRRFPVEDYLLSTGIIFRGRPISRLLVVQYVANRLGGAHLDHDRADKEGQRFVLLDEAAGVHVNHLPAIYNELWAIGQDVARSGDARRFLKLATEHRRRA